MKGALKLLEGKEYDSDIADTTEALEQNTSAKASQERKCRKYSNAIEKTQNIISDIERKIGSIPAEIIDIVEVKEDQISKQKEIEVLTTQISDLKEENKTKRADHKRINEVLEGFDIDTLRALNEEVCGKKVVLEGTNQTIEQQEYQSSNKNTD
jgi:chromosome segregation ATPase